MEYRGINGAKGSLVFVQGVHKIKFDEIVRVKMTDASFRLGRVIQIHENTAIVLVFEGTRGLSLKDTNVKFTGRVMEMGLSEEILGRVFDGLNRPRDGLGEAFATTRRPIDGNPLNPTQRIYPRNYIETGFSAIDTQLTLIRGQKLPIFSSYGLPHDKLAAAIAIQARCEGEKFAVVFAAMGVQFETAEFFRKAFTESGQTERTVMFLNLASDPPAERLLTPRFALTAAEFLAYDCGYHVLVILTDMTAYAEALREISSTRGETPARKGFPGYMYSDLASIYERAGIRKNNAGSLTQIPILTMPGEDITHPIPDLTGYITEGQIVLDRTLHQQGIFPPIAVLPSLSRLMKDGIGEKFTTKEHPALAAKLFATYAEAQEARALATVIGEEDLTENDKNLLEFAQKYEKKFLHQQESRPLAHSLNIAQEILH
jgi:V/A-type H+-transporting ATPase subunit B